MLDAASEALRFRADLAGGASQKHANTNDEMKNGSGGHCDSAGFWELCQDQNKISGYDLIPSPPSPLTHENLGIPEVEPLSLTETRRPSDAEKVYTYLDCLPVKTLRNFCKELQVVQKGTKAVVVERVFVTMGHIGAGTEYSWDLAIREIGRKCGARS